MPCGRAFLFRASSRANSGKRWTRYDRSPTQSTGFFARGRGACARDSARRASDRFFATCLLRCCANECLSIRLVAVRMSAWSSKTKVFELLPGDCHFTPLQFFVSKCVSFWTEIPPFKHTSFYAQNATGVSLILDSFFKAFSRRLYFAAPPPPHITMLLVRYASKCRGCLKFASLARDLCGGLATL